MSNINVRVVGTANVSQMGGAFGKLEGQVGALNAQLARMVALQNGVDGTGFNNAARAAEVASANFRNAAASTGMFNVQQLRLNDAADEYVKKLNKQQMTFKQMYRDRRIAASAFKKQLALENATLFQSPGSARTGKNVVDFVVPNQVAKDTASFNKQLAWMNAQLKSGANQMVNWGKNTQWAGRQLMVGLTMPVAAFGAAAGVMAYQIDKELTRVQKVYDTTADAASSSAAEQMKVEKELMELREAGMQTAINAAQAYGSAGKDTVNVQAELAATGIRGANLQKATSEVMRISALGELEYADAIQSTISLQSVFKLSTTELTEAFNYMNQVENATSLQTKDFAQAIPIAAAPVKAFGGDIKELGILLTAMRERGIEATQGANAIKAAMQRLGRPSKQIQEEWTALTGTDITKIFKDAKDLRTLFTEIGTATENLGRKDKIKAFAGLFGTYQVTRMSALVNGMKDLEAGTGQVSAAAQAAGMSFGELADVADRELGKQAESVSGKWDRALRTMQLQLATLGEPFIELATVVVNGLSAIIAKFNELPGFGKKAIALAVGLAAIAGPLIMLTGLFGNLTGMGLKGISMLIGLGRSMNILDDQSRAAALQTKLTSAGFVDQATQAQLLTANLQKLTAAYASANTAQQGVGHAPRGSVNSMPVPSTHIYTPGDKYAPSSSPAARPTATPVVPVGANQLGITAAVPASAEVADNTKETSKYAKAAAASMTAMAAGMLLTSTNSDGFLNSMGQWLIISSMVVPAVVQLGPLLGSAAAKMGTVAVSAKAAAVSAFAGGKGMTKFASGALAASRAVLAMMGPIGLIATIVTGIGVGIFAWRKQLIAAEKEETRLQLSVNNAADTWAKGARVARKEWDALTLAQSTAISKSAQQELDTLYKEGDMKSITADFDSGEFDAPEQMRIAKQHFMDLQAEYGLSQKKAMAHVRALMNASGMALKEQETIISNLNATVGKFTQNDFGYYIQQQIDTFNSMEPGTEQWEDAGKDAAAAFGMAFNGQMTPGQAEKLMSQFSNAAEGEWQSGWESITTLFDGSLAEKMEAEGINSGAALRRGVAESGGDISQYLDDLGERMNLNTYEADALRGAIMGAGRQEELFVQNAISSNAQLSLVMGDNVKTLEEFMNHWFTMAQGDSLKEAQEQVSSLANEMLNLPGSGSMENMDIFADSTLTRAEKLQKIIKEMMGGPGEQDAQEFKVMVETIAEMQNIKIDDDPAKTYLNIMRAIKNETEGTAQSTAKIATAMRLNNQEAAQMVRTGMQGVQQDIADDIRDNFDNRMNSAIESRQTYWDNRKDQLTREMDREQDAMSNRQERATEAMSRRHEREQRAMDNRWERRTNAAERYWDKRVEGVEKAIEAEQKAEERRQKMFDAEIARINRLNDMQNTNIDFNVALNKGDLDEAAKIRNNAVAQAATWNLEAASEAGNGRSERRIDKLESRQGNLEKARERHMRHLQKMEENEQRSLERRQENETKALQKRQEREVEWMEKMQDKRQKALEREADADMESMKKIWEHRKESLEDQLQLFLSFIAKNERELKKHMKKVGISYQDFGEKVLKPKGENWSQYFGNRMKFHIRAAGLELRNDKMWENLGKSSAKNMLKGIGFKNWKQFSNFLDSGNLPNNFNGGSTGGGGNNNNDAGTSGNSGSGGRPFNPATDARHEGGWIGEKGGSRKGIARTQKGLHPSEVNLLAKKGEFMVNERAAKEYGPLLENINSGGPLHGPVRSRDKQTDGGVGGAGSQHAGLLAGAMTKLMNVGIAKGIANVNAKKQAELAAQAALGSGLYLAGKGGVYGDRAFTKQQLTHAATIASVGSRMGMSKRDIRIGIMTAITESGLALPNQAQSDRDSAGLFQQRPSQGWGTVEQVMNPEYASRKFFNALKGVSNRDELSPWMAAQTVQRSAYSNGSNYRQYWDEANAIFREGLTKTKNGGYTLGGFIQGTGGWKRASAPGKGWSNTHDYANQNGSRLYAVSDGIITDSRAIRSGGSSDYPGYPRGYTSYGETIAMRTASGDILRYAHLRPGGRFVKTGDVVKGGALIGRSGMTGNASGWHTHFDVNGDYNASGWMRGKGIGLRKGASNINYDNVPTVLHKNEAVLTEDINRQFRQGVESFARGPGDVLRQILGDRNIGSPGNNNGGSNNNGGGGDNGGNSGNNSGGGDPGTGGLDNVKNFGPKGNVRVGSYNVAWKTGLGTTAPDMKRLMNETDVLALQEVYRARYKRVQQTFRSAGWGHTPYKHDSMVGWDKSKFDALRTGNRGLNPGMTGGGRNAVDRQAAYALLKNKKSGGKFWAIGTHLQPFAQSSPRLRAIQNKQIENLGKMYNEFSKTAPVVVMGDLNRYVQNAGMGVKGMESIWDRGRTRGFQGTRQNNSQRYIDHILFGDGIGVGNIKTINKGMDSDHRAVLANLKIPGMSTGGFTVNSGLANLHDEELVIDKRRTKILQDGIEDNFASGSKAEYNLKVVLNGADVSADEVANTVINKLERLERRKPQRRRS